MKSGAIQLEKAADALERSLRIHRQTDEANAARTTQAATSLSPPPRNRR